MKKYSIILLLLQLIITSCSTQQNANNHPLTEKSVNIIETKEPKSSMDKTSVEAEPFQEEIAVDTVTEIDLSQYFEGINGCAVLYQPEFAEYSIYNVELSEKQSSPCSTFKIISSLMGLEQGVIDTDNSVLTWNGTQYWKPEWNRDIGFADAFRTSCIWYFREVTNRLGEDIVLDNLKQLEYGNCDISDWEGRLNTNNNNRDLTGFWVESSLIISPKEQARVLSHIFEEKSNFSAHNISLLKEVMQVEGLTNGSKVYGKTGMGVKDGRCIDAWFVGLAEDINGMVYFAVRLEDPDNPLTSSQKAREIALNIIADNFGVSDGKAN